MAICECVPKCPFFNDKMANKPSTAEMFKKKYCEGDNSECARWIVRKKLGADKVPADLFPNQIDKAQALIKAAGK